MMTTRHCEGHYTIAEVDGTLRFFVWGQPQPTIGMRVAAMRNARLAREAEARTQLLEKGEGWRWGLAERDPATGKDRL